MKGVVGLRAVVLLLLQALVANGFLNGGAATVTRRRSAGLKAQEIVDLPMPDEIARGAARSASGFGGAREERAGWLDHAKHGKKKKKKKKKKKRCPSTRRPPHLTPHPHKPFTSGGVTGRKEG